MYEHLGLSEMKTLVHMRSLGYFARGAR